MTVRILKILVRLEQGAQLHLLEQPVVRPGEGPSVVPPPEHREEPQHGVEEGGGGVGQQP